jgi:hypothetical protein
LAIWAEEVAVKPASKAKASTGLKVVDCCWLIIITTSSYPPPSQYSRDREKILLKIIILGYREELGLAYAAIRWNQGEWLAGRTLLAVVIFSGMSLDFGVLFYS